MRTYNYYADGAWSWACVITTLSIYKDEDYQRFFILTGYRSESL